MIHWKTALRSLSALAGFFWIPALAFIFGMPGTILSLIAVEEGGGRAYGIALPVQRPSPPEES
jgi:hypothetical protein